MSSLKFGTSGLRGLATDLAGAPAALYVRAFCAMIDEDAAAGPQGEVLIGRDLRASSPAIAGDAIAAVAAAGLTPVDCGAVPTPALALAAMQAGAPAVMVTGSHIPAERNGLKFYRRDGEIDKRDEARILGWRDRLEDAGAAPAPDAAAAAFDPLPAYRSRYVGFFGPDALDCLMVGVYQHSSVARDLLCEVLTALGAFPVPLGRADTFVPVDTEALRAEDEALALGWAGRFRLDAIVSTDGDADRPLIADESGRFLRGDLVGALSASALGAEAVVTPVTSNSALERPGLFAEVVRTKVGSPHVIAGMERARRRGAQAIVGFEANGGVLLGSEARRGQRRLPPLPTRDALLPILACLDMVARIGRPLSALAAEMGFAAALSNRLENVAPARSAALIARLDADETFRERAFAGHGGTVRRDDSDGLRLTLGDGATLHFRASGNAPELRVYVEAADPTLAEALLAEGMAFARAQTG